MKQKRTISPKSQFLIPELHTYTWLCPPPHLQPEGNVSELPSFLAAPPVCHQSSGIFQICSNHFFYIPWEKLCNTIYKDNRVQSFDYLPEEVTCLLQPLSEDGIVTAFNILPLGKYHLLWQGLWRRNIHIQMNR